MNTQTATEPNSQNNSETDEALDFLEDDGAFDDFQELASSEDDETCGDLDMRIDRNGVWYYHGSPIGRKELVCLFASVLQRDEVGDYWLITPAEKGRIEVEDVPFMAVEMFVDGCCGPGQVISFRTNVDEIVTLDDDHPLRVQIDPDTGEPSPYVLVRECMEARLTRAVYYDLVARGLEQDTPSGPIYGVWSGNRFFELGRLEEDV